MRVSRIQQALRGRVGDRVVDALPVLLQVLVDAVPLAIGLWVANQVLVAFSGRLTYPYDLEWMEGGMLAHAWRVQHWMPLYMEPDADWIPYIYPPGYPAVVAGLSTVTGLSATVGRAVSVTGTLAACAALVFAGWRHGRSPTAGLLGACLFLACYPDSGAFYDLVRPDALGLGLLSWAVVLGIEPGTRARVASGLLLAMAFTVKHNLAAFGVPMVLGIAVRFGLVEAAWFVGASAIPALLFTLGMQLASGGHFLVTILGIPGAHPMVVGRFLPGTVEELARDLGAGSVIGAAMLGLLTGAMVKGRVEKGLVALCACGGALALGPIGLAFPAAARMPQPPPEVEQLAWVAIGAAIGAVVAAAAVLPKGRGRAIGPVVALLVMPGSIPVMPEWVGALGLSTAAGASVAGGLVFVGVGLTVAAVQQGLESRRDGASRLDGRWLYGVGLCAMALLTAGLMRGHHGGFLNVYIPMHWFLSLGLAVGLAASRHLWPRLDVMVLGSLALAVQLYLKSDFDPTRYTPTAEDVEAGDRFVDALRDCDGPVLSPFNPWLPALAGHAPSFHLIALWDIDHRESPYRASVRALEAAADAHHWACVVSGNGRPLGFGIQRNYVESVVPEVPWGPRAGGGPPTFMPRTGWRVRPYSILVPR
ncbi:MAG: hypothetical protein R3F61_17530 [Myxococcota bacterium]